MFDLLTINPQSFGKSHKIVQTHWVDSYIENIAEILIVFEINFTTEPG